jgi:long-chain fatty acid transport protein
MKLILSRKLLATAIALSLAAPSTVFATNGYFMIGWGAKASGMGGAGVAYPQDGMAAAYNPAGMTEVGEARMDLTLELFRPPRAVSHDSQKLPANERSEDDLFPIPAIGAVLSDPGTPFAMGMAVVGAGAGTRYPQQRNSMFDPGQDTPAYKQVGVFLMQMQMLPSLAFRVDDTNSIGFSVVIAMQTFRAFGLEAFKDLGFSNNADSLTNKGNDWSFGGGYRLGWLGKFFDNRFNVGINYAPKVHMQRFNLYKGLFPRRGEFDIPENYTLGFAFKATPKSTIAFDIQQINYSKIPGIGNLGPNAANSADTNPNGICGVSPSNPTGDDGISPDCKLGGELGMGFGWKNQVAYKLGMDYKYRKDLTFRGGLNYGRTPIRSNQILFNFLAPATVEKHVTLGMTQALDKDSDITYGFMHAFQKTIKGPTMFSPPPGGGIVSGSNASISMSQTSLSIAYGLKF